MLEIMKNHVIELEYLSKCRTYPDPFDQVEFGAQITDPDGKEAYFPGFWAGGDRWKIRYSSDKTGVHKFRTICSDKENKDLSDKCGEIKIKEYDGTNSLYLHGGIKGDRRGKYLVHSDGTPFFWLGDTWWMGLTKRLKWPEGFGELAHDRVKKGFSVIQIVAGLYPDMIPFDQRGANETGLPWEEGYKSINAEYFNEADKKIAGLVELGLVPCIVGCWGFFMDHAGIEIIRKHWGYLLARYGAYPVVWCMAGEALMPFYTDTDRSEEHLKRIRAEWTIITRELKENDPFHRLITIHPTDYGHKMVDDESLLDLDMLQTGHSGYNSLSRTVSMVREAVSRDPGMPVINSEVCYEGICGTSYQDIQRFLFWSCVLSGACGHTYGANGIWQLNSRKEPYGPSPHGATWGNTPWEEAYKLPGSFQSGIGRKLLERYRWWKFKPHPEWVEDHANSENKYIGTYCAGIPGEARIIFKPFFAGFSWGRILVKALESDVEYRAYYFDPVTGEEYDQGNVQPDKEGNWRAGNITIFQDWILVLEKSVK